MADKSTGGDFLTKKDHEKLVREATFDLENLHKIRVEELQSQLKIENEEIVKAKNQSKLERELRIHAENEAHKAHSAIADLKITIQNYLRDISELKIEISKLSSQLSDQKEVTNQLIHENENLAIKLRHIEQSYAKDYQRLEYEKNLLENEIKAFQFEISDLSQNLKFEEEKTVRFMIENNEFKEVINRQQGEIQTLMKSCKNQNTETLNIDKYVEEIKGLESELSKLKSESQSRHQNLTHEFNQKADSYYNHIESLEQELNYEKHMNIQYLKENDILKDMVKELKNEPSYKDKYEEAMSRLNLLEEQVRNLHLKNEDEADKVLTLQSELKKFDKPHTEREEEIKNPVSKDQDQEIQKSRHIINSLQLELRRIQDIQRNEMNEGREKYKRYKLAWEQDKIKYEDLEKDYNRIQSSYEKMQSDFSIERSKSEENKDKIQQLSDTLHQLEAKYQELEINFKVESAKKKHEIFSLSEKLFEAKRDNMAMSETIQNLNYELESYTIMTKTHENESKVSRSQYEESLSKISELEIYKSELIEKLKHKDSHVEKATKSATSDKFIIGALVSIIAILIAKEFI